MQKEAHCRTAVSAKPAAAAGVQPGWKSVNVRRATRALRPGNIKSSRAWNVGGFEVRLNTQEPDIYTCLQYSRTEGP